MKKMKYPWWPSSMCICQSHTVVELSAHSVVTLDNLSTPTTCSAGRRELEMDSIFVRGCSKVSKFSSRSRCTEERGPNYTTAKSEGDPGGCYSTWLAFISIIQTYIKATPAVAGSQCRKRPPHNNPIKTVWWYFASRHKRTFCKGLCATQVVPGASGCHNVVCLQKDYRSLNKVFTVGTTAWMPSERACCEKTRRAWGAMEGMWCPLYWGWRRAWGRCHRSFRRTPQSVLRTLRTWQEGPEKESSSLDRRCFCCCQQVRGPHH